MASRGKRKEEKASGFARHAFTPTRENGRHPHALRQQVVLGVLALVLIAEVAFISQTLVFSHSPAMTASVLPAAVTDLTNEQRTDNGLQALETSPLLTEAAQEKANDMAAKGYFAHVSPSGQLPWYWFQQVGYNYQFAGENLAINFSDSSDVVNAWMNSPMHRANILKQEYTQIGIGIAEGVYQGQETTFVVQFFGSPEPVQAVPVAVVPAAPTPKPAPAPAQPSIANVSPTIPVETAAQTPVVPAGASLPAQGEVLGAQTQPVQLSWYQTVLASPSTYLTYALFALAIIFIVLLSLGFLPFSTHWPHPNALINGSALVVVLLGLILVNQSFFENVNVTPSDSQNASAIEAVGAR